jgi:glycerol uptake facilitator-like aquaporin
MDTSPFRASCEKCAAHQCPPTTVIKFDRDLITGFIIVSMLLTGCLAFGWVFEGFRTEVKRFAVVTVLWYIVTAIFAYTGRTVEHHRNSKT